MGCCISKCRAKKKPLQECGNVVQDKLVITQAPSTPSPLSNRVSPAPSPSPCTSSFSSFSCATANTNTSCSSSTSSSSTSSASSTVSSLKDRSFSNEFLWSCVKDNPQIIRNQPTRGAPHKLELQPKSVVAAPAKQFIPQNAVGTTLQKRARASSPTLTRQKSFRREPQKPDSTPAIQARALRSPSPSRRFNGDKCREVLTDTPKQYNFKRSIGSKVNPVNNSVSSYVRKENILPSSPKNNINSRTYRPCLRKTSSNKIGPNIGEIAAGELLCKLEVESMAMEDIDNPLISLDCFIFL